MSSDETKQYIKNHIKNVRKGMRELAGIIVSRSDEHDASKLEDPELSGYIQMDQEPRYQYGTKEYKEKMQRYSWLFKQHWRVNRHHPEYFKDLGGFESQANLIDVIEMLCDWLSYKNGLTYLEATKLVSQQCKRFHFSETMEDLLMNTLRDYFVDLGGFKDIKQNQDNEFYQKSDLSGYTPVMDIKA